MTLLLLLLMMGGPECVERVEVVSARYHNLGTEAHYVRVGWTLELRNRGDEDCTVNAELQFLDVSGFEVDRTYGHDLEVPAGGRSAHKGTGHIRQDAYSRIARLEVELRDDPG